MTNYRILEMQRGKKLWYTVQEKSSNETQWMPTYKAWSTEQGARDAVEKDRMMIVKRVIEL